MRRALLLCAALLAAWSAPASAQALGERLAACAACHGAGGAPAPLPNSPTLAGQPALFIENQLVMIREGLRDVPAMKGLLDGVSDADLAAMAKHFAGQPLKPQPGPRDAARFARGEQVANGNRCASCHLPNYAGREQMPRLAGQREDYLLHSMRQFLSGQATGRDTIMAASLRGLSDADLQAMAHYFAQLPP
ncbi:MAG: c-type cytochrome [Hydrogenophaga sp.]|uniref:C-type cytochrome n=1 Tax=Hydrogenophaga crocea TaxID=2716225 RepID=A0A6G8IEP6_9BURK|nr:MULTISPECIES: c-type cytochrome [Hydrogenophaga]MBL0943330.1 c-type cytochrome [Hydrogenophaga sp.]QIM51538.1 c-type cytochrome [Hydrogenophaga crocea]